MLAPAAVQVIDEHGWSLLRPPWAAERTRTGGDWAHNDMTSETGAPTAVSGTGLTSYFNGS